MTGLEVFGEALIEIFCFWGKNWVFFGESLPLPVKKTPSIKTGLVDVIICLNRLTAVVNKISSSSSSVQNNIAAFPLSF